ncbi:MAG TPA: MraY family glycosyltransferase [Myxococcota bacterium]|nr:MraY family glycosyltransferase [Myxococcota bacterium]
MTTFLVSFLLAFVACLALTPVVLHAAGRAQMLDAAHASHRKVHTGAIPRLGGVAIVTSFYVPMIGLLFYSTRVGDAVWRDLQLVAGLLGGGLVIAALGLYDDLRQASPRAKLVVQVLVALALCSLGFRIERLDLPFLPMIDLGILSWPLTVAWIVGVTNAVNLIDGLDGLAAGIALFGLAPMVVLAVSKGNLVLALVCCCLAGSLLGFLGYNFHPARIFMGDSGSMFIGFVLAVVSVATASKGRVAVAMLTPILALGMPILDTLLAIARRAWFGQSLFVGDRGHIHHRLLDQGFSHRNTVLVMYGFAGLFATLGLGVHFNRDEESALLFLLSMVVAGVLLRKVGYLVLPQGFGSELAAAQAIRERNRLIRSTLVALDERLAVDRALDAFATALAEVGRSAGACQVEIELRDAGGSATRTWRWEDPLHDADLVRQTFHLRTTEGRTLGVMEVAWVAAGFHPSALPSVEVACVRLADRHVASGAPSSPRALPAPT